MCMGIQKKFLINDKLVTISNLKISLDEAEFEYQGKKFIFKSRPTYTDEINIISDKGESHKILRTNNDYFFKGESYEVRSSERTSRIAFENNDNDIIKGQKLMAPMPGKILKLNKKVGEPVVKGEVLLIMEAMKMEHALKANKDGVVSKILKFEGEQVSSKEILLIIDEE